MSDSASPVVVFGGTGHYGSCIVGHLVRRGVPVRVLSRDCALARRSLGEGPELVEGDVAEERAVAQAVEGARSIVICLSAMSSAKLVRRREEIECHGLRRILDQARRSAVQRVVYLSGYEMRETLIRELRVERLASIYVENERALAASGLAVTVLGCPPSTDLFFALLRGDRLLIPGGGPPAFPTVSPEDVGAIGAQTALRDDLAGRRIHVTGPAAVSFPEVAQRLSAILGRPIRVLRPPLVVFNVASALTLPFNPYLRIVYCSLKLLNNFPPDLAAAVPDEHAYLRRTYDYAPRSLEEDARQRFGLA